MNMMQFAMQMIQNNPRIKNNPQAMNMIDVIQRGDSAQGQKIAENLCHTYGMTREQATQQAKQFFKL